MNKEQFTVLAKEFLSRWFIKLEQVVFSPENDCWYGIFTEPKDVEFQLSDFEQANKLGLSLGHNCLFERK